MNLSKRECCWRWPRWRRRSSPRRRKLPPPTSPPAALLAKPIARQSERGLAAVRAELAPNGLDGAAIARLRTLAAADFGAGRVFVHEGWRLSRTEGRLFALLAAA